MLNTLSDNITFDNCITDRGLGELTLTFVSMTSLCKKQLFKFCDRNFCQKFKKMLDLKNLVSQCMMVLLTITIMPGHQYIHLILIHLIIKQVKPTAGQACHISWSMLCISSIFRDYNHLFIVQFGYYESYPPLQFPSLTHKQEIFDKGIYIPL